MTLATIEKCLAGPTRDKISVCMATGCYAKRRTGKRGKKAAAQRNFDVNLTALVQAFPFLKEDYKGKTFIV
ncbi:MAG: hypothetical protein IJP25_02315 [Elusimicrobiaceae bacterium]|nr:hypothetical protein [Elusimicrobiaceae bacterium]